MALRDLIFSLSDNRGTGFDREPGEGEYMRRWEQDAAMCFFETPARYEWTGTELIEFAGWEAEQASAALAAAQEQMIAAIIARENEESWKPIEHPEMSGVFHKATDAIARTTKRFRDLADGDPFPLNGGMWRDASGNPVPMTMEGLRSLEDALFDRAAHNDGVAQYHIQMMLAAENPLEYDFSGGWA